MLKWRNFVSRVGVPVEARFARLQARLRRRARETHGLQVLPYRGFGNGEELIVKGRVLRKAQPGPCRESDRLWDNVLATYRRFNTREVPNVQVELTCGRQKWAAITDRDGYYEFQVKRRTIKRTTGWMPLHVGLPGETPKKVDVLVPGRSARFGVISDVDDTVVMSHVRNLLKMARTVFLQNARGRVAFPGVAAFYRALLDEEANPIFYVSSGPWNLYDLLVDFFDLNDVPAGPLLLQDFGVDDRKFVSASHHQHKMAHIKLILRMYPDLPFILIGDSGQHDPEIYAQALEESPNRIMAIYIRDVSGAARSEEVRHLAIEAAKHGGELLLVKDSLEAARHAADCGWISHAALPEIGDEKVEDLTLPEPPLDEELANA